MLNTARINAPAGPMPKTSSLKDFRRIVVKVGSSLLVDSSAGQLKRVTRVSVETMKIVEAMRAEKR